MHMARLNNTINTEFGQNLTLIGQTKNLLPVLNASNATRLSAATPCCLNATVVFVFNASRDLQEQKENKIPKSNQIPPNLITQP